MGLDRMKLGDLPSADSQIIEATSEVDRPGRR